MAGKANINSWVGFKQPSGKLGLMGLGENGYAVVLAGTEGDRLFWEIEAELEREAKAREQTVKSKKD